MPRTRSALAASLPILALFTTAALAALPAPEGASQEAPVVLAVEPDTAVTEGFELGVRGRPVEEPATIGTPEEVQQRSLRQQLDAEPLTAAIDAKAAQKSHWSDLSKTTKIWFIVGGALFLLIILSALD